MTLNKKDLIILAGETLKWSAENDCVKDGDKDHAHFTVGEWCTYFEHSDYTFKRVKQEMVELGIKIALRSRHGHYISDSADDIASTMILSLKNIVTRLETFSALADSSQKSKHSAEVMERLRETVDQLDLQINANGVLTFQSKANLLAKSV